MAGVDAALERLEPVALLDALRDERVALRQERPLQRGQGRGRARRPHVGPDHSSLVDAGVGDVTHLRREARLRGLTGHLQTLPVQAVLPAVIDAAHARVLHTAEVQRSKPVRAELADEPRLAQLAPIDHETLAQDETDQRAPFQPSDHETEFQADQDLVVLTGIPGMTMDPSLQGRRTGTLCLFHPDVRAFWTGLVADLCKSYDIDGIRVAAAARRAQTLRPGLGLRRGHRPGGALRGRVRAALLVRRRRVRAVARERLRSEADRRCARRGARPSVDRARVRVASGRRDGRALAGAA